MHFICSQLAKLLMQEGPKKGIEFHPPSKMERLRDRVSEDIIYNKLLEFGQAGCTMVLVIMTANAECYGIAVCIITNNAYFIITEGGVLSMPIVLSLFLYLRCFSLF